MAAAATSPIWWPIRMDPDGVSTAGILGALVLAAVGPRRLDFRGAMSDLNPAVAVVYVPVHGTRELAMLDCMYRPRVVPEDRAGWMRPGDAARIGAWLSVRTAAPAWTPRAWSTDPTCQRRYACMWSMRRIITAMLAAGGDLQVALRTCPTAA